MTFINCNQYTAFWPFCKGVNRPETGRVSALKVKFRKRSFYHGQTLLPPDAPFLSSGRIYASLSLHGRKSAADKSVEVFVFSRFSGTPVELV